MDNYNTVISSISMLLSLILILNSLIECQPINNSNIDSNHNDDHQQQTIILNKISDPIGEAFRKKLSELTSSNLKNFNDNDDDDNVDHSNDNDSDNNNDDDDEDMSNSTIKNQILIDRLTLNEINEYKKNGQLPERTKLLIENFLYNSTAGKQLLANMFKLEHPQDDNRTMNTSIVTLKPIDRYEIINEHNKKPIILNNEHEFEQQQQQQQQQQH